MKRGKESGKALIGLEGKQLLLRMFGREEG